MLLFTVLVIVCKSAFVVLCKMQSKVNVTLFNAFEAFREYDVCVHIFLELYHTEASFLAALPFAN